MISSINRSVFWLLVCCLVIPSDAVGSDCGPALYRQLTPALKDPAFKEQARDWVRRFQAADAVTHRGMLKAAIHKNVKALKEGFRDLPVGGNPFAGEEEVYRAIARFTDPSTLEGVVPGLDETVKTLFSGADKSEVGALLELKVADDIARTLGEPRRLAFQKPVAVPGGGTREIDVTVMVPGAPSELGGVCRESKNWPNALRGDGANFGPLRDYAQDNFLDDILLHSQYDWQWYVLDLRKVVRDVGDDVIVKSELLKGFADPGVVAALGGPARAAQQAALFEQLWDAGILVQYH